MVRNEKLADEAKLIYITGKHFLYDCVNRDTVVPIDSSTDRQRNRTNIKVSAQRRSMKGILLLFVEPYAAGAREPYAGKGFRKIHLSRAKKNQRHDKRSTKHAVQQRHRKSGHLERSKPIFHEKKNTNLSI